MNSIRIRGARTHNLKNIDVEIPRDKLVVITGLSGSGKSSLAFDTIYAEGQRRYVESLSAYARQFLSLMEKPDMDSIEGLSPAISIEQKATSHNPRSTVGTVTEIYDYLRLLFARVGEPRCPTHGVSLHAQTISQMVDRVMDLDKGTRLMLLAPVVSDRKGEQLNLIADLRAQGFVRARIDGDVVELDQAPELVKNIKHSIEVVVDRIVVADDQKQRLAESFETALNIADGLCKVALVGDENAEEMLFSAKYACPHCGYSLSELEPRLFSFNNPAGACPDCDGLGKRQLFDPDKIIRNPELSIAGGALSGWDRRHQYFYSMLESVAAHYSIDLDAPWSSLPEKLQRIVLYGSKSAIEFVHTTQNGRVYRRKRRFRGVIPILERRYRESESSAVREDLARYISTRPCKSCGGARLRTEARHVFIADRGIHDITGMPIAATLEFFHNLHLQGRRAEIAEKILKEVTERLGFLINVGLDYLTLARSADTLSGGESQRIRLASQIGAGLLGVMYVLDEPSIGLHQRDNERLLETLRHLRDIGNTVIVVEHDEDAIRAADHVLDLGPGAGVHGGEVVAAGAPADIEACRDSLTGQYLSGRKCIPVPERRTLRGSEKLVVRDATGNNLKSVTAEIPIGLMTCITGVSGSGKSTLINDTLYKTVARELNRSSVEAAPCAAVEGLDLIDKVVDIDQSPIGRTPRSNPATYTGLFTPLREIFAGTQEARSRGYKPGRFSFNVKGGRCEACQGDGMIKVEMHFLADVYVACDVCKGARYNRETLEVEYKGRNIRDVLDMTIEDASEFFSAIPVVKRKLDTLMQVGLGYIKLGQSATTLSGGEAQRIKLARELSKRDTGKTLYILDEPTTGLHFDDIRLLLNVLNTLRDHGNTIVIIEHNLDVIKTADWIIDLGPEGGDKGGEIIAAGTPEDVASVAQSHTGKYLKQLLNKNRAA
ncbi:MAG: excinuclease ABC subunit UvrA [Gammaproteobacteria bacterium]|nr:MAG: excinuclease ABC subunit UvrA [Gammaproteobacteria bacterium]